MKPFWNTFLAKMKKLKFTLQAYWRGRFSSARHLILTFAQQTSFTCCLIDLATRGTSFPGNYTSREMGLAPIGNAQGFGQWGFQA